MLLSQQEAKSPSSKDKEKAETRKEEEAKTGAQKRTDTLGIMITVIQPVIQVLFASKDTLKDESHNLSGFWYSH